VTTVALGEVVDFYSGGTPAKTNAEFWDGEIPWFSPKDMKKPRLTNSADYISDAVFGKTSLRKIPAGTVAIVVRGMILAHTVPIAILDVDSAINQDLKALLPRREIDASFLAAVLRAQHDSILAQVSTAAHGTKKLDSRVLENIRIPLPALHEQRRVAAILGQADALRTKRRQVLANLNSLTQSIFIDMFGEPETWPMRWDMGVIGDMTESVQYGTSAKAGSSGAWPILRMGNVTDNGRLDLTDLKYIDLPESDIPKYTARRGDLLFNRTNSMEKVGKSCVVDTDRPLAIAGYLVRVRFKPEHRSEFVCAYLTSRHGIAVRRRMAKAAVNQANINATEMRGIAIAQPPTELQEAFVRRVEAARAAVSVARTDSLEELFASLQARAFRGEL
jgi:type I restriction enzyme S subunit